MKHLICLLTAMLVLSSCNHKKSEQTKPTLTVSIAPQKYFIDRLMGDVVDVNVMIPQGSNHATYSPSALQIKKLSKSIAYIKLGHISFETNWMDKLTASNTQMKVYDLSEGISVIHDDHHHHHHDHDHICSAGADPHTWTSPKQVYQLTKNLKAALTELFPQHKELIVANYEAVVNDIDMLDERLTNLSATNANLSFMIFHPAYTYLADSYGFNQLTIEFEGKTPTPARLKSTIEQAQESNVEVIYIQQEFDQSNANVVAKEIGAEVVQVNPLSEDWLKEMNNFIGHLEKH